MSLDVRMREAAERLEAGDAKGAYDSLRWVFREPGFDEDTPRFVAALRLFAGISRRLSGEAFADIADHAADEPDDVQALYDLGYELVENDLSWPAVCVLTRALSRAPDEPGLLSELVCALENDGRHAEAVEHLRGAPKLLRHSFLLRYLLVFNEIMRGDLAGARRAANELGDPDVEGGEQMKMNVENMLARADLTADVAALDDKDLRGWHFVITGGLLLHVSPHGFDAGMHGRYAFTQDSFSRCKHGLLLLREVLQRWDVVPQRVLALPDRDSSILATAAGTLLGLPVEPYASDRPGLVVAYDFGRFDDSTPDELGEHQAGQILYAHATCWTDPPPCAPDLTLYLYQSNVAPWDGQLAVGPEGVTEVPADEASVDDLAAKIAAAEVHDDPDEREENRVPDLLRWADATRSLASAFVGEGDRPRMWAGGPVLSSRFA
jgi:hypothetical protein